MVAEVLPDQRLPMRPGEVAWLRDVPRPGVREGVADELAVVAPNGDFFALIPEVHRIEVEGGKISVSPSIVSPRGGYHGFLIDGVWS